MNSTFIHLGMLLLVSATSVFPKVKGTSTPQLIANTPAVWPRVKGTPQLIANVTDPTTSRDSCGSVRLGDRALWVCRDSQGFDSTVGRTVKIPLIPNTASWTSFDKDGTPAIVHGAPVGAGSNGSNPVLLMYSSGDVISYPAFFPEQGDECGESGVCPNGTRYALWPSSPPMVAGMMAGGLTAYSWVSKDLVQNLTVVWPNQPFSLYKFTYMPPLMDDLNDFSVPSVSIVDEEFWLQDEWGYGEYGNVVRNGTAYLYAQNQDRTAVALAKVAAQDIENRSRYQYYVGGKWTTQMPPLNDSAAFLRNFENALQGTFYYSEPFASYIWIGQSQPGSTAEFTLTTAPRPEGPWIDPYVIYTGERGDGDIGAYSLQANPALLRSSEEKAIYLSWTQQFQENTYGAYVTPLVYVEFK